MEGKVVNNPSGIRYVIRLGKRLYVQKGYKLYNGATTKFIEKARFFESYEAAAKYSKHMWGSEILEVDLEELFKEEVGK